MYATTTTTELFFRQAVGRFVRWTHGVKDQKAFLFIPDDPRLRRWAGGIAEQRRHSRARRNGGSDDPLGDGSAFDDPDRLAPGDDDTEQLSLFSVISAVAHDHEVTSVFDLDDGDWAPEDVDDETLEVRIELPAAKRHPDQGSHLSARQRRAQLRKHNADAVAELVRFTPLDHRQVNAELNRLAGIAKVSEATSEQLQRRLDAANKWLRRR